MYLLVTPTKSNKHIDDLDGAYVSCWIKDYDPMSAYVKANFDIKKYDWNIEKVIDAPTEVSEKDFIDKDIGLELYHKAEKEGRACIYSAWPREGSNKQGRFELESSHHFDLFSSLSVQKKLRNKGRCLHYLSGKRCNQIINAHSIQKNGVLSVIANNGKVYQVSRNISDLNKKNRFVVFVLGGIKRVSTFKGFCKTHDNELFEPIDNYPLIPNFQQGFLYAYRSICKELFVKENALESIQQQYDNSKEHEAYRDLFWNMLKGVKHGYKNLCRHKDYYDSLLKNNNFKNIKYVAFLCNKEPVMAFSGILYPEFDFMGNPLQDLSNEQSQLDLITFSSAPINSGWAIIFSWHDSSSKACLQFMGSLASVVHEGYDLGDHLFRLVIATCENIAFSPVWWESLSEENKKRISVKAAVGADIFTVVQPNYLQEGLDGISKWEFSNIYSEME